MRAGRQPGCGVRHRSGSPAWYQHVISGDMLREAASGARGARVREPAALGSQLRTKVVAHQ
jgi:hypothetical protein